VRPQELVELVQDHPGPDSNAATFQVQVGDLAIMPGKIDDQAFPDRSARQAGARSARSDCHPRLGCGFDDRAGLARASWKSDRLRFNPVNRRVSRVELPG
jgi:hypothetical protein